VLAVDTDILVRCLTGDDPEQTARARGVVEAHPVWVALTVLLETEWVLRRSYRFEPVRVARALRGLLGLPTVTAEQPDRAAAALAWMEGGMDFADALHLAGAVGCEAFVTFDAALIRAGRQSGAVAVRAP
jgi:predicted nucleic-acid-binding protein